MKVRFIVDSGTNIYSNKKSEWLNPVEDMGLDEGKWESYTEDEKHKAAEEWAGQPGGLHIFYEEQE